MSTEKKANPNENPAKPQRDAQGRFVKGNSGGPGNPFGRHLGRVRTKWNSMATPDHVENVYKAVYEKAIGGCVAAMKLYLQYLLGKPRPMPNPDHVDLEEWDLYAKATRMQQASPDVMTSPDHRFQLEVARTMRPVMAEEARKGLAGELKDMEEMDREAEEIERQYEERHKECGETAEEDGRLRRSGVAGKKRGATEQRRAGAKREATFDHPAIRRQGSRMDSRPSSLAPRPSVPPSSNGFSPPQPPSSNGFFDERGQTLIDG